MSALAVLMAVAHIFMWTVKQATYEVETQGVTLAGQHFEVNYADCAPSYVPLKHNRNTKYTSFGCFVYTSDPSGVDPNEWSFAIVIDVVGPHRFKIFCPPNYSCAPSP
jgi:hypothetical protein